MPDQKKTDESVKTGLEIESEPVSPPEIPETGTEKDLDELVHQQPDPMPDASEEIDIDSVVHQRPSTPENDDTMQERDPDDLVHGKG